MTGRCKNITLPQTSFVGGKNTFTFGTEIALMDIILPTIRDLATSAFSIFLQAITTRAPLAAMSFAVSYPIPVLQPASVWWKSDQIILKG